MEEFPVRPVVVKAIPIELCQLLKFGDLTSTGGEAKMFIAEGLVSVNGERETRKRRKLLDGDVVEFRGQRVIVKTP